MNILKYFATENHKIIHKRHEESEKHNASNHSYYECFVFTKNNKNKLYLNMQFIGKPTSRLRILLKSIEKQKWWEAAGMTIFCADTGSEELDTPTGLGWDIAIGPLSAENTKDNSCAFLKLVLPK